MERPQDAAHTVQGLTEQVLMAQLARRHYVVGQSKLQIAAELGMSRFKVARLLDTAVRLGIVKFEVGLPGDVDLGLSAELCELFGLKHCVVVEAADDAAETVHHTVGTTATAMLADLVKESDVLGMSTTQTMVGIPTDPSHFPHCPIVQMTGAISRFDAADVMEAMRRLSRVGGGPAYIYYAPMISRDARAAQAGRKEADFLRCQRRFADITIAAVGVGAWQEGLSQLYQPATSAERVEYAAAGAVGEVCGVLFDRVGRVVPTSLTARMVSISEAEFRAIPTRIGIVYGLAKRAGLRSVLHSGILNALVVDRQLAESILEPA